MVRDLWCWYCMVRDNVMVLHGKILEVLHDKVLEVMVLHDKRLVVMVLHGKILEVMVLHDKRLVVMVLHGKRRGDGTAW